MKAKLSRFIPAGQPPGTLASGSQPLVRESLIFFAFVVLTIAMTWPWARMIRDAVPDPGDAYLNSWILWWDYYQTFHDPLHLFQAPILYPYQYTLAFSEHNYGISLLFFPLFALGVRPVTVQGVAELVGFILSGYGAFRLARTLSGANGAAWVTGIVFGFAPYRFHQLGHLNYMFCGWIPLLLEALVLFTRRRTWRRAIWLGLAFAMNALTCIHWFVLTLIPLGLSGAYLLTRYRIWRDRDLWLRGGTCLGVAGLALLPFLLPYRWVSQMYGIVRTREEATFFSARVRNWLSADPSNKLWRGFGPVPESGERALFPGLLPIVLLVMSFPFLRSQRARKNNGEENSGQRAVEETSNHKPSRKLLVLLDVLAVTSLVVAVSAYAYGGIAPLGLKQLHVPNADRPLAVFFLVFLVRLCLAYPRLLRFGRDRNLVETMGRSSEAFVLGLIWTVVGFCGSLGMNFFFHRLLFEYVFLFRSIRVPARWGMLAFLGIALLAGLGARRLVEALRALAPAPSPTGGGLGWGFRRGQDPLPYPSPKGRGETSHFWSNVGLRSVPVYVIICAAILFEQRAAPLQLVHGEVDPDAVTLYLKQTPMRGGIVHLPAGGEEGNYRYVLRQADHHRPLVTAVSGFGTPILNEIELLFRKRPIPNRFFEVLEETPVSYLAVHSSQLRPEYRVSVQRMLGRGISAGRLRYIRSFAGTGINGNEGADLYAVVKTEPEAKAEAELPFALPVREWDVLIKSDAVNLLGEYQSSSQAVYRLYVASYGQRPRYAELLADMEIISRGILIEAPEEQAKLETRTREFADSWVKRAQFKVLYERMETEAYIDALARNAGITLDAAERAALVDKLNHGEMTRAQVLLAIANSKALVAKEDTPSLVLLHYFGYLHRNPDDPPDNNWDGFDYWTKEVEKSKEIDRLGRAFMASGEFENNRRKR